MDTITLAAGVAAAAVIGGSGYAVGLRDAAAKTRRALAHADSWQSRYRKVFETLFLVEEERDQQRLLADGLQQEVNRVRAELFDANTNIATMRPLYELGLRRRQAMDRQLAVDPGQFHRQVYLARSLLIRAGIEGKPIAPEVAAKSLGLDRRRAAYVLKAAGGTMIVTRTDSGAKKMWVPEDAAA